MVELTDDEIAGWADTLIRQNAFNRPVAVQIAKEAAKWVQAQRAARVDGLMALVYLYGAHCAEHPEDADGARERLRAVKDFALGVKGTQ